MSEATAAIAFDVQQTEHGLRLQNWPEGKVPTEMRRNLETVSEWPTHLYVPRLFYLWAVDNEEKKRAWAKAKAGILCFYLENDTARYALAHPADDGHHWDLLDRTRGPAPGPTPARPGALTPDKGRG